MISLEAARRPLQPKNYYDTDKSKFKHKLILRYIISKINNLGLNLKYPLNDIKSFHCCVKIRTSFFCKMTSQVKFVKRDDVGVFF